LWSLRYEILQTTAAATTTATVSQHEGYDRSFPTTINNNNNNVETID
jgi:hypothetical protein